MPYQKQNRYTNQTVKRAVSWLFLICFVAAVLISEIFILTHSRHEHNHDSTDGSCTACIQIQSAENVLNQINSAVSNLSIIFMGLIILISALYFVSSSIGFQTLVGLKIRIND